MRVRIDPALHDWAIAPRPDSCADDRRALIQAVNHNADRLGTATLEPDPATPLIATGHQAFLWHPGILAKDIALRAAALRFDAQCFHLIVDQDVHEAWHAEQPVVQGDTARVERLELATTTAAVPTGQQPPADITPNALPQIDDALIDAPPTRTLAEQLAVVLDWLKQPIVEAIPIAFTSDLARLPAFHRLVDAMLNDPVGCVEAYNTAVKAHPEARAQPLARRDDRVELPLWSLAWLKPRTRVYADPGNPGTPLDASGQPLDRGTLAPRALAMTALLRSALVDLFIHGLGGAKYDRITDHWLEHWAPSPLRQSRSGIDLAPATAVSADLHLDLPVPVASPDELRHATWLAHHLPHNLDRRLPANQTDPALVKRKADILQHMDDDRDPKRRATLFAELHAINDRLAAEHPQPLRDAQAQLQRARAGIHNHDIATKRDWPFPIYPQPKLQALADAIASTTRLPA